MQTFSDGSVGFTISGQEFSQMLAEQPQPEPPATKPVPEPRWTITQADHAELSAETARLEAELIEAQTRYSAFRAGMNEMDQGDWRRSYQLGRRVQHIQQRLVDIDRFLLEACVAGEAA